MAFPTEQARHRHRWFVRNFASLGVHNTGVASFRDRYDPETIHFPVDLSSKFLISLGLVVNVATAAGCLLTRQSHIRTVLELLVLAGLSVFYLLAWPRDLRVELRGIASQTPFGRRVFLGWKEITHAGPQRRRLLFPWLVLDQYVVRASDGRSIVHTTRHPDRERFVLELRRHGAAAEDAYPD